MANKEVVITQNDRYAAKIFLNSAIPLLRVVAADYPKLAKKFAKKKFIFQMSANDSEAPKGKQATYFIIDNGVWTTKINDVCDKPDLEFEFSDLKHLILFFTNRTKKMPKIKGMYKLHLLLPILMSLLKMAGLLGATDVPADKFDAEMLVKLYFYLLPGGISQLNKAGHPLATAFTKASPDRVWALMISGRDDLASWIRVKDGNSKAGRGINPRCAPFLSMEFDNVEHALNILMGKADMLDYVAEKYLIINGAPEMAGDLGNLLFAVGDFAQGKYLDKQN